jgi:periplasmic divalent cation tolerance protein
MTNDERNPKPESRKSPGVALVGFVIRISSFLRISSFVIRHSSFVIQMIRQSSIAFVTAPNLKTARSLATAALKSRLAACANLIPEIESHYWWQGKVESSAEVLILFKTTKTKLKALEKLIVARHPYDTPEFIALPITKGNRRYLEWVRQSVTLGKIQGPSSKFQRSSKHQES